MTKDLNYSNIAALTALLLLGFLMVEIRLFHLQILRHEDLGRRSERYDHFDFQPAPWRGQIRDRNGQPLVLTIPVKNVYADLTVCTNRLSECFRTIVGSLHLNPREALAQFCAAVTASSALGTICVKSKVTEPEWQTLSNAMARATFSAEAKHLKPPGKRLLNRLRYHAVFALEDQTRIYLPGINSLGPVLGSTQVGPEGQGLQGVSGIEGAYDALLAGAPGLWISKKSSNGQELPFLREQCVPPHDGCHLELTIDSRLQKMCAQTLCTACESFAPSNATVLVIRPHTGEILAWVSWPYRDPLHPFEAPLEAYRNHAIMDGYEPGSTFKMITLAAALNEKVTTLDQLWDGEQGRFVFQRMPLHDRHPFGLLTVREATAQSVNI